MSAEHTQSLKVAGSGKSWHGWENDISLEESHNLHTVMAKCGLENVYSVPLMGVKDFKVDAESGDVTVSEYLPTESIGLYDSRGYCLGIHGAESYKIHQPEETLKPYWEIIEAIGGFRFDFMARLRQGKVWTANFVLEDDESIVSDKHGVYLAVTSSFDGSFATSCTGSTIRRVCMNTVNYSDMLESTVKTRFRHRRALPSSDVFRRQIEQALEGKEQYKRFAEMLAQYRIQTDAAKDMLSKLLFESKLEDVELEGGKTGKAWTKPSTRTQNRIDALIKSYETSLDETAGESTAWTILNAVTRFADHEGGVRMTEDRKEAGQTVEQLRFESNLYGPSNAFKNDAIAKLKEAANIDMNKVLLAA
jgi:hypothetical protein